MQTQTYRALLQVFAIWNTAACKNQGCTDRPPYNTKYKIASVRVGSRSVHCASGGGHRPSPCLLFSIINRSQGAPLKRRFCVGGVQKMLGSWLGSTWIHFVTCHEKCIFCKEFAWILAWIHLDPVSHIYKN